MSKAEFFEDLFEGNFSHAFSRLQNWWVGALPAIKAFIAKAATDEGKILEDLVAVAILDVEAGGFTTASFVAAGKDVLAKLIAQNIATFNMAYVMAMLNIHAAPLAPVAIVSPPDQAAAT